MKTKFPMRCACCREILKTGTEYVIVGELRDAAHVHCAQTPAPELDPLAKKDGEPELYSTAWFNKANSDTE